MSSDLDVIKAIVDAFENSDWADIEVSSGSLRIHLSTQPQPFSDAAPAAPAEPTDSTTAETADVGPTKAATIPAGAHVVSSPSPGIFWRSPHPGAPHFADVGDDVRSGSTLAIVEVMKLMNHISSGIPGTVVGVFVENGMRVDRGDALFAIQPSASP
ncbi:MAG: acetyl-CoA carboxylase biotin carboxyl carrier protein [Ilumatobacteraceae bacterium]